MPESYWEEATKDMLKLSANQTQRTWLIEQKALMSVDVSKWNRAGYVFMLAG